jgi:cell division protein ZapA (FtsZ GTPase activity inhibitor)
MPILNLAIGRSKYVVDCFEGEEDKIINLAKKLNERVNKLSLAIRTADEKTILMLCALMAEEELETAKSHKGILEKQAPEEKVIEPQISEEDLENAIEEQVAMQIENTADYIFKLVKKVESL